MYSYSSSICVNCSSEVKVGERLQLDLNSFFFACIAELRKIDKRKLSDWVEKLKTESKQLYCCLKCHRKTEQLGNARKKVKQLESLLVQNSANKNIFQLFLESEDKNDSQNEGERKFENRKRYRERTPSPGGYPALKKARRQIIAKENVQTLKRKRKFAKGTVKVLYF